MIDTLETLNFRNSQHCLTGEQVQKKYKIHNNTDNFNFDWEYIEWVQIEKCFLQKVH